MPRKAKTRTSAKLLEHLTPAAIAAFTVLLFFQTAMAKGSSAEAFRKMYSQRIRDVKDTTIPDDDLKLAEEILKSAGHGKRSDELRVLMYDAVYDLASKWPAGHRLAYDATDRLARAVPAQAGHCWQMRLELLLNRLNDDCDELLRTYVKLAAGPLDKLETIALKELGEWYGQLADRASLGSKAAMLRRGEACRVRFLAVYTEKDATRIKAALALSKVRRELKKLGVGSSGGGGVPRTVKPTVDDGKHKDSASRPHRRKDSRPRRRGEE